MTDEKRCEPPPELRDRDGWHWVQYKQSPMCRAEWSATEREWFFPEDQTHSPVESLSTSWRYLASVTPPATVAVLEAEVADLRKKQGAWEDDARVWQAEAARLRSAVAVLVEALEHLDFDGAGDAWANLKGAMIDMEHSPTAPPDAVCWRTLNRVLAQLQAARAAIRALGDAT